MDAKIEEKQAVLEGYAVREETLRRQLVVSQGQARSFSETAARIERELSYAELACVDAEADAAAAFAEARKQAIAESLAEAACVEEEDEEAAQHRARARRAIGL